MHELIKKDYLHFQIKFFTPLWCTSMLLEVVEFFESIERDQRIVEIYSKTSSNNYFYEIKKCNIIVMYTAPSRK